MKLRRWQFSDRAKCQESAFDRRAFLKLSLGSAVLVGTSANLVAANFREQRGAGTQRKPKAWGGPMYPSYEEIRGRLELWQREFPSLMKLDSLGTTAQGRQIYAARLTNSRTSPEQKEHVLITALHAGLERSAAADIFYLMKWLLSKDAQAREIMRRQVVVFMPLVNPDGYVGSSHQNSLGFGPYNDWTLEGPKDPEKMPEAMVVKRIMDEYQPEVHADYHGVGLEFSGYIMGESSGASYSNSALRSYHSRIIRLMNEAALAEGYPSDHLEQDAERIIWGAGEEIAPEKKWYGRPRIYAAIYSYNRYHTIPLASEVAWTRSGFLRHRRLLQFGIETWPGEYYPGYPTRVISMNTIHAVIAYGETAAARRRSRVELWNKQRQIVTGINNPFTQGLLVYVCTTSPDAAEQWLTDKTLKGFVMKIENHGGVNASFLAQLISRHPRGPFPEPNFYTQGGSTKPTEHSPIEHGIAFRLRIPFPKLQIERVTLNGYTLGRSTTAGYQNWISRGWTYLQVNIAPEKSRKDEIFIITCEYKPLEKRVQAEGW